MGRSLDVLDVGAVIWFNATVGQLLVRDFVSSLKSGALASPVPIKATNVLQTSHLLVSQVGDDLEHVATVSINTENIVMDQMASPDALLEEERAKCESTDDPLCVLSVLPKQLIHDAIFIL